MKQKLWILGMALVIVVFARPSAAAANSDLSLSACKAVACTDVVEDCDDFCTICKRGPDEGGQAGKCAPSDPE
jgi:hypothetical protein